MMVTKVSNMSGRCFRSGNHTYANYITTSTTTNTSTTNTTYTTTTTTSTTTTITTSTSSIATIISISKNSYKIIGGRKQLVFKSNLKQFA